MSYNYPPRWRHIDPIEALVARFGVENWMVVIRRSALHSRRRDSRDTAIALRGYGTAALALGMKMAEITLGGVEPYTDCSHGPEGSRSAMGGPKLRLDAGGSTRFP